MAVSLALSNQQEAENKMEYKNTKTGVVINTQCVISGGDWVPCDRGLTQTEEPKQALEQEPAENTKEPEAPQQEIPKNEQAPVQEPAENIEDFDGITIAQIKQELDAFGVEYNPKDKKQVLYDLMMQHGK